MFPAHNVACIPRQQSNTPHQPACVCNDMCIPPPPRFAVIEAFFFVQPYVLSPFTFRTVYCCPSYLPRTFSGKAISLFYRSTILRRKPQRPRFMIAAHGGWRATSSRLDSAKTTKHPRVQQGEPDSDQSLRKAHAYLSRLPLTKFRFSHQPCLAMHTPCSM